MKDNPILFLLACLWKYNEINRTSQSPGTICLYSGGGGLPHVFFIHLIQAGQLRGSAGPAPCVSNRTSEPLDHSRPSHLTRYPLAGKRKSEARRLQRQQSGLCCSYLRSLPDNHTASANKGVSTAKTLVLYMPFSSTSPVFTTMLTNGKQRYVLKPINYYYGLCKNKDSGDHSLFFYC